MLIALLLIPLKYVDGGFASCGYCFGGLCTLSLLAVVDYCVLRKDGYALVGKFKFVF